MPEKGKFIPEPEDRPPQIEAFVLFIIAIIPLLCHADGVYTWRKREQF